MGKEIHPVGTIVEAPLDSVWAWVSDPTRFPGHPNRDAGDFGIRNGAWGPFPIQPVVIRSGLDGELKERLRTILLSIGADPHVSPTLAEFGLERFAPVTYEHYAPEEQALRKCERTLGTRLH